MMKTRFLTEKELEDIFHSVLDTVFPKYLPLEQRRSILEQTWNVISQELAAQPIYDDPRVLEDLRTNIVHYYHRSMVQSGESVGVLCAQAIGERQTQLSVHYDTPVLIQEDRDNKKQWVTIGSFIDDLLGKYPESCVDLGHESIELAISTYDVMAVSPQSTIQFRKITSVSRHPPHGKLVRITTGNHRSVVTTLSHSHLQWTPTGIQPIEAKYLKKGDLLPCWNLQHKAEIHVVSSVEDALYVVWEPITEIESFSIAETEYVYDFSVEQDETFLTGDGIFVHNTLNSFHQSGLAVQTVLTGVPRFLELLNATKEPKMSSNRFQLREKCASPHEVRQILGSSLVFLRLQDIVKEYTLFQSKQDENWYGSFEMIYSNQFRQFTHGISLFLDLEKIYRFHLYPFHIAEKIEEKYQDLRCVFSPLHLGQIDVYVDTIEISLPEEYQIHGYLENHSYLTIYLRDVVRPKLEEIILCGIEGIQDYHIRKVDSDWIVETQGDNFIGILSHPAIQSFSATSNNMWKIFEHLGIEAVRQFLLEEFTEVVSADGSAINTSHIQLLVDIMTHQGVINSVSRYGMRKDTSSVLSRSSFEESLEQFCNAGFYSEKEMIRGVSASIMVAKRPHVGTGVMSLLMNTDTLQNE